MNFPMIWGKHESSDRPSRRLRCILALTTAAMIASAIVAQEPAPSEAASEAGPEVALESRFRAIELRDGVLYEPLPGNDDLPVIEISGGELWIDGEPATAGALAGLGELEPTVRALAVARGVGLEAPRAEAVGALEPIEPETPVVPEEAEPRRKVHKDDQVVVGGNLVVEENEVARDVVVFGGRLIVRGRVSGDAAVIGGSAEIEGEVDGDVAIVGGSADIGPGARIGGDVETVGGAVSVHDDAVVEGEVNEVSFGAGVRIGRWVEDYAKSTAKGSGARPDADVRIEIEPENYGAPAPVRAFAHLIGGVFFMLFVGLVSSLALLFLRGPIERMADATRLEPAKCGLVGLVAFILFVPLLVLTVLILTISIIGIPLLILVPFALVGLGILVFLGFVASALELGRFLRERFDLALSSPYALMLLGLGLILIWGVIGDIFGALGSVMSFFAVMLTLFGCLAFFLATTLGLGAALITRAGTRAAGLPFATGGDLPPASAAPPPPPSWDDPADDPDVEPPAPDEPFAPAPRDEPED